MEHPNLCHHMSAEWMAEMRAWLPLAVEELKVMLANQQAEWSVTRIGAVGVEIELCMKMARLFLYSQGDEWCIMIELLPAGIAG